MEETVFSLLYRTIRERKEPLADHLVNGGAKNYEEYLRVSTEHRTLCSIEDDIKGLEERFIDQ
jgi:hypothetical protein